MIRTGSPVSKPRLTSVPLLILAFWPASGIAQPSLSTLPTRSVELELTLGSFDDPILAFSRIGGLTMDSHGRLYVLQPMENEVTVINPDGSLHQRIGRRGQGPGEFMMAAGLGWQADTLWVMDGLLQRLSWFLDGDLVRTRRFVSPDLQPGERIAAQWPMSDGSRFTRVSRRFEKPAGHAENYFPLIRSTPDEEGGRVVAVLRESYPSRFVLQHSQGTSYGSPLFSDFPLQSTGGSGERLAIVDRPFGTGPEALIRLTVLLASGDTAFSREYAVDVAPLTDRQWNERIREALAGVDRPTLPYGAAEVEEASRRPAHWPSATRVVMALDHRAWIALGESPSRDDRDWVVIDDAGAPLFRVRLPRAFRLYTASGDLLLGTWQDEFGVPYIHRYRIGGLVHR